MAEGRRKAEWYRTAFATCAIANTWRGSRSALKIENFPYCHCQQSQIRMATRAECKAFAENFFRQDLMQRGVDRNKGEDRQSEKKTPNAKIV